MRLNSRVNKGKRTTSSGTGPVRSINSTARISSASSIPASSTVISGSSPFPWWVYRKDIGRGGTPFVDVELFECILAVSLPFPADVPFTCEPPTGTPAFLNAASALFSIRSDHAVNSRESFVLREILKNNSARYLQTTFTTMSGSSLFFISCWRAFSFPLVISALSCLI